MSDSNKRLKKKILQHLHEEVYCRLGISPLHGIGVFALRAIPKAVNPLKTWLDFKELEFTSDDIKRLPRGVRKQISIFCYYDETKTIIPSFGINSMDMAIYLNHSKTPNLKMKKNGTFISLRPIRLNEELTMDYDHSFGSTHIF